ncbi:MAG: nucleoside hydrolase [Chloroflexota bacterium]
MIPEVIIDTDPGVDDTMAIFYALRSPDMRVIGLTTVFGNTDVSHCTANALRLLDVTGHTDIPVAQGSARPLIIAPRSTGKAVHGEDGFGNIAHELPPITSTAISQTAAAFIVEQVMASPGKITLLALGPLTNLALVLRLEPRVAENVHEVVIMGGAATVPGNASPVAEANIWNDPHAAAIVFGAGWPVTMIGLDVTHSVSLSEDYLQNLFGQGTPEAEILQRIMPVYQSYFQRDYELNHGIYLHDPTATICLVRRDLFQIESIPIYVETEGLCSGQTVYDRLEQWRDVTTHVNVCLKVAVQDVLALYQQVLSSPANG